MNTADGISGKDILELYFVAIKITAPLISRIFLIFFL
jgi:hypothetical protein